MVWGVGDLECFKQSFYGGSREVLFVLVVLKALRVVLASWFRWLSKDCRGGLRWVLTGWRATFVFVLDRLSWV